MPKNAEQKDLTNCTLLCNNDEQRIMDSLRRRAAEIEYGTLTIEFTVHNKRLQHGEEVACRKRL